MNILYILECIAYLVSIPALIVMTRFFHYELKQNQLFISRHWTNKNQFSPGASAPTLWPLRYVRAYYHVHYYHHGVMWIACVCARCEKMFHMFHGLSTLWNIYVEHNLSHSRAAQHRILARMFQCSIKNRTWVRLTVDRCYLFFNFINQKVLEHMEHFPFIQ